MTGPKRVTMQDVARSAGVAKITVSRALQDSASVRPALRERIKTIAAEKGYRLNTAARDLRRDRTSSIAVVIEMNPSAERPISEPLVMMLIGGLLHRINEAGYRLILTTLEQFERTGAVDADGVILVGQGADNLAATRLQRFDVPLAIWGVPMPARHERVVFIASDNHAGGHLIAAHLSERGRKRILFLGDVTHAEVQARFEGLTQGGGADDQRVLQVPCAFSTEAGRAETERALAFGVAFDAVVAASDSIALGAMAALRSAGRAVPAEVAVVGFDDTLPLSNLTSVRQDLRAGGEALAGAVIAMIDGGVAKAEILPVTLEVRGSSDVTT